MPSTPKQPRQPLPTPDRNAPRQELVDPSFLLKAFGLIVLAGLIFAYVTLCVLYSRTQWQIVLHPSRTVAVTPASVGENFTEVHFGTDSSGEPQLDGWWIPSGTIDARTVLMLHGERGSMADSLLTASLLRSLGLNVLLFDYRGYGKSGGQHPTQALMRHDAHSALEYLTQTRKLSASSIIVYGHDLGASLAVDLCKTGCSAMILDAPDGDLLNRARAATRSAIVPTRMLFHENFPLAAPLADSTTPKLIFRYDDAPTPYDPHTAADPKMVVMLRSFEANVYASSVQRFLDAYSR